MTYGQLKFRLSKMCAGLDADILEGAITDCYLEILGALPWSRMDVQGVLQTVAPYSAGTVNVTNGSDAVTLTGGAWSSGMTNRQFHITGDSDEYVFTYLSATTGTLDRTYEGTSAPTAGYSIYQAIYTLPSNCRFVDEDAFNSFTAGHLRRLSVEQGQKDFVAGMGYPPYPTTGIPFTGVPRTWWPVLDDNSTPPNMQVRFFPIPDQVYGIPFTYGTEAIAPGATSTVMQAWLQPAALIEGSIAKIKRHLKDYTGAQEATKAFNAAMAVMVSQEAYRRGPTQIEMGGYYTAHRVRRGR